MSLENLTTAIPAAPSSTLTADEVAFRDEKMKDQAALGLVLGDVSRAESFLSSKQLLVEFERADNNYRAFGLPKNWPGTEAPRAGLTQPVVMEAIEKLMPAFMLAFFSDPKGFLLERMGKTTQDVARMWEHVLAWAVKEADFKEEIRKCLKSCLLYGFCVARWGWKTETRNRQNYSLSDGKVSSKSETYDISHPTFENVEIRKVLIDPSLREQDVRKGRYVIAQVFTDAYGLDDLRGDKAYKNIPTREELRRELTNAANACPDSFASGKNMSYRDKQAAQENTPQSADPLKSPLEILEYVAGDRVITVLERLIVIRNDFSGFDRTTFLSSAFIDVPGSAYGLGVSDLLQGEQYLQTDMLNKGLDAAALYATPAFTAKQGLQTTSQNVKVTAGKIITGEELKPIPIPDVMPSVMGIIEQSENRAARRVGANGGSDMPTQAMRTAEGVNAFGQDVVNKVQYFIEIFSNLVYIPALEAFIDVCKQKLQPEDIKLILSEHDEKLWLQMQADPLSFYKARCNINVLASTKLAQRRAAAQLLPMLMNLAAASNTQDSLTAQGKKFNYTELLNQAVELAGWDIESLVQDATPEDIQKAMAIQSPQQAKAQIDQQTEQVKNQNVMSQIEETGVVKAGVKAVEMSMKHALEEGKPIV
jgi:hypothetical protein